MDSKSFVRYLATGDYSPAIDAAPSDIGAAGFNPPTDPDFESKHPRGNPANKGQFRKSEKTLAKLDEADAAIRSAQPPTGFSRAKKVDAAAFHRAISDAVASRPKTDLWRVSIHSPEEYEAMQCFATDGGSVFALNGKDIVSVCKHKGDVLTRADEMMAQAVEEGGDRLDSYDGNHGFYAKCGFEPVAWTKFDPQYAPDGALPEDVVFYRYTGNKRRMKPEEAKKDIEAFKAQNKPMDYDTACDFRNHMIDYYTKGAGK